MLSQKLKCGEWAISPTLALPLETPDDHVAVLPHQGERIAIFSQEGATEESIQAECALHLVKKHGWEGAL